MIKYTAPTESDLAAKGIETKIKEIRRNELDRKYGSKEPHVSTELRAKYMSGGEFTYRPFANLKLKK